MDKATRLRRQFDESFRTSPAQELRPVRDRLTLLLGQRLISLPLIQVAEVLHSQPMTPLPGSPPGLLGLVGLRGTLLPVFCLAELLGEPRCALQSDSLWILVVTRPERVGLALEARAVSLTEQNHETQELDLVALVGELERRFKRE